EKKSILLDYTEVGVSKLRMVRNYKRKTDRANWSEEQMKLAILAVENKELSIRKAAVVFGVPKDSLNRRVQDPIKSYRYL
ncbi:charged multivesicular body 1a-like, partial [Paramuricea clavata]